MSNSFDEGYKKWKKEKEQAQDNISFDIGYGLWKAEKAGGIESLSKEIENRVNTWLQNNNNFISNAQYRAQNRGNAYVKDSKEWLATVFNQKRNFDSEAENIKGLLNEYKDVFNPEWVNSITSLLDANGKEQYKVLATSADDNYFWSQFESEDDYNRIVRMNQYRDKYSGKSYEEILANINALSDGEEKEWLNNNKYWLLPSASDFADNSQYKSTYRGGEVFNNWSGIYTDDGFDDIMYDYINRDEKAVGRVHLTDIQTDRAFLGIDDSERKEMEDEEIAIFNYLYATQGSDSAYEFIEYITSDLNARQRATEEARWAEYAKESPIASSTFSVVTAPLKGLSYLGQFADYVGDGTLEQNAGYNKFSYTSTAIRNEVSKQVEEKWGGAGSFAYQTGMSLADFLFTTATTGGGALTLAVMGSGAAADMTISAKDRGLSDDQAFSLGTIAGVAEAAMEKIGLDALFNTKMLNKSVVKYILSNALAEGGEEVGTDVINTIADIIIAQDQSLWQTAINNYMAQGKSESEAFGLALADKAEEMGLSFLGGAISGGVIGGGGVGVNTIGNTIEGWQQKKQFGSDIGTFLAGEAVAINPQDSFAQKMQAKATSGKELSSRQVGKLLQQNETGMRENDMETIKSAAQNRLNALGETVDVEMLASALAKQASGVELSHKEKNVIKNSKYGQRVANELNPDNINSGEYSSAWAENIGTDRINVNEYNRQAQTDETAHDDVHEALMSLATETAEAQALAQSNLFAPTQDNVSPTKENAVQSQYEVSADGKTINTKNGEIANIKNIESISENGEANLTLDDGMVVKASDLSYGTEAEGIIIGNIGAIKIGKNPISTTSANALYMTAMSALESNPNMTADEAMSLIKGLEESYIYGTYNFGESKLTATDEYGSARLYAGELSQAQRKYAYELGTKDAVNKVEADQKVIDDLKAKAEGKTPKKTLGKVIFEKGAEVADESALTDTQRANLNGIKLLAEISSVEFHVFRSDKNNKFKYTMPDGTVTTANGWYVAGTNQIWIDLNAGNSGEGTMVRTAAHEISHYIKEWSPQKWRAMADMLMEEFAKNGVDTESMLNKQIAKIKRRYNKNNMPSQPKLLDMAYEELVCDALSDMLTDGSIVNFIAEVKAKDASLGKKIINAIKNLLKKWGLIIDSYKGRDLDTAEAQALSQFEDTFKKLQELYQDAFMDANETVNLSKEGVFADEISTKFEMRDAVEETADLVAFHNITPELLLDALNRNGLLMPSIAVTDKGLSDFGAISLLFDKDTIDPRVNDSKLFGADAWTPTQTKLKKNAKFDTNKTIKAVNNIKNLIGSMYAKELFNVSPKLFRDTIIEADGSIYDAYAHNIGMQTAYAKENGSITEIPTRKDGTVDTTALQKRLDTEMDTDNGWRQYKRWLNNISDTVITNFDNATNEDILRNMQKQKETAKAFKLTLDGQLVVPATEYSSIDELRSNKNRLSAEADKSTKRVANALVSWAKMVGRNTNSSASDVVRAINKAFANRYSVADIVKAFKQEGINISALNAKDIQALYKQAVELPTQYFEAKPQRTVNLDEIKAVVIPSQSTYEGDIAEVRSALEKLGVPLVEYVADSKESRVEALNSVEEVKFSERNAMRENKTVTLIDGAKPISPNEIITEGATVTDSDGNKYSIRSMKSDIAEGQMFEDLKAHCGFTQSQVNTLKKQLEDLVDYMTPFRDILDMNETYGREGRRYAPYKPNSDPLYTISLDFSTQCSKRLLTQYVIEQLQLRENRPMSAEEQMAIRDMLKEYGKIEKGLQVACVMCYVEAARLKSPKQIQKWLDDPATAMRNFFADKNPEFSAYIKKAQEDFKESRGYERNTTKKDMKAKDRTALNKIRPKLRAEYKPSAEEMAIIETAKALPNSTYLTAGNLADLSETHPEIYKAYTAFIRTATRSKALETDEPYYYGDSTRENGNGIIVSDSFIEAVNRENGMRFSSWSDWRIQHLLDWITAVIDNSVRGAAMHGYTKYGDEVRVLGKTGMMFNMSGVPGTQTGLDEDGSLNFSETESMDYNEAIALRKEFPETAGLQCIGVSKEHIFALLRSDIIDYVIPYHTSGLNATLRRMGDIYGWKDFTYTQHATENKSIKKENAIDPDHWHQEPVFSEFFVGYNSGLGGIEAMRKSADNYIRMCEERGLTPKFAEFSKEPNYWKLLIDRKMVNQKTNTLIEQKAVTPKFDFGVIKSIVDQYVKNYDSGLEERAFNHIVKNWDSVPQRIKDLKKQGTAKAKSTKKAIDKLANEPLAVQPKGEIKPSERDSEGNTLSKEQQEFFKDSKVRDKDGNLLVAYHVTPSDTFYEFDSSRHKSNSGTDVWGKGFYFSDEKASYYWSGEVGGKNELICYLDIKKPFIVGNGAKVPVDFKDYITSTGAYMESSQYRKDYLGDNSTRWYDFLRYSTKEDANAVLQELGYDGIIVGDNYEIVIFNSNQAKLTSNKNPTENPDIRYSERVSNEELASMDETALYIKNTKKANYIGMIFNGTKTEETRSQRTLDAFVGKEFYVTDGKMVYGSIVLGEPHKYTEAEFHKLENQKKHRVPKGDEYDVKPGGIKWAYPIESYNKFDKPKKLSDSKEYKNSFQAREVMYSVRGESTATEELDKQNLETAKKMDEAKVPMENIRLATGWYKQSDGKWRSEFSSKKIKFKPEIDSIFENEDGFKELERLKNKRDKSWKKLREFEKTANKKSFAYSLQWLQLYNTPENDEYQAFEKSLKEKQKKAKTIKGKLADIIYFPELFKLYPQLKDVNVVSTGIFKGTTLADWNRESNTIRISKELSKEQALDTLTHEIQHAIQDIEGFEYEWDKPYRDRRNEKEAFDSEARRKMSDEQRIANPPAMFSERDTTSSNRAILANALESVAQNDIERNKLAQYKEKISLIETEEQRLSEIQKKLFTKGAVEPTERKDLQFEAKQISNRINTYDRQLLNLESTTALKNVLNREKALAMKKQKQKDNEYLKQYKEKVAKDKKVLLERNQESRKKAIEGREKTAMRHKIKSVVNDLNNLLLKPSKERHVPEEMRIAVAEALAIVNMDTVDADTRVAHYNDLIAKATDPDVIASLTETRDRILNQGNKLADKLTKLKDAYSMVRDSADESLRGIYDDVIYSRIESVQKVVGKTPLRNMTLGQLESVYDLYKMVLTTIRDSNKAFAENITMTRLALGSNTFAEIKEGNKARDTIKHQHLEKFLWQNLKPMQAMKTIGSGTLQKLWNNILYGQEVFAVDYDEAVKFAKEMKDKHGYEKWNKDKLYSFDSKSGKTMKLTLEQMMSIYAYSKRAQADEHIEYGGIVLNEGVIKVKNKLGKTVEVKVNDSTAYRLDKMQVASIVATLEKVAPGAKAFVDEMQKYLSETMGEKGNEVSMKMYGIKLFKEEHYFPLKSSKDFMEAANAKLKGDVKIKNKGMTKSTVEHARNPIVLENFLDVWGNHINEMAMYHGLVLPLEDFSRTLNYSFKADDQLNTDAESVRTALHDAFGDNADNYLNELLKAINGGVLHDSSAQFADRMISKFKKSKVMASLSVIVQQPTAIIRAMGIIEPKYFVAQNFSHKATWEELKKYCPTAIIKETGSFDTNMGRTIVDMIKDERGFTDKVGDVLGKAPAYMDEMGWNMIWRALKKKVATEQNLSGEALLQECGKQMTLIINETQVYDSVMSRNELMRSKNALTKMATAFMGEPTTVANMIYGASLDFKRGYKGKAGKAVAATIASVVINSLVSAIVYAMRDDDEEKTFLEKYISSATTEVVDGLNPLTYIPFVKDAYSLFQGYKVERTDMALIKDVVDAIDDFYNVLDPEEYEGMSEKETAKHIYENSVPLLTAICDMFGLPVGNVLRDAEAIIVQDNAPMSQTSSMGTWGAFKEGILSSLPQIVSKFIGTESNQDQLYDAIVSGDTAYIERLKSGYKDEASYETAVRKALRENDERIKEAAEAYNGGDIRERDRILAEIVAEGFFDEDLVIGAITAEANSLNVETFAEGAIAAGSSALNGEPEEEKATSIYKADDVNVALESGDKELALEIIDDLVKTKVENGMEEDKAKSSVKSSVTSYWKPIYKAAYQNKDNEEMTRIRKLLLDSGLYGRASQVSETCRDWIKELAKEKKK